MILNIGTVKGDDPDEGIYYNAVWYSFHVNYFILSSEPSTVDNPRQWMEINEKGEIVLSTNPRIDRMKLYEVLELFNEELENIPRKAQQVAEVYIENQNGTKLTRQQIEIDDKNTFYLVIMFKNGFTVVYDGALLRIGVPLGYVSLSELDAVPQEKKELSDDVHRIINEFQNLIRSVIKESHNEDPVDEFKLIFQVFEVETTGGGKNKLLQHLRKSGFIRLDGSFPHWLKNENNFFVKEGEWNINGMWSIAQNYALYNESARIIREQFRDLENYEQSHVSDTWDLFHTGEIKELENRANFFPNALNMMNFYVREIKKDPLIITDEFGTHWTDYRSTIIYLESLSQNILNQRRQMQTRELAALALFIGIISIFPLIRSLFRFLFGSIKNAKKTGKTYQIPQERFIRKSIGPCLENVESRLKQRESIKSKYRRKRFEHKNSIR